MMQRIKKLFGDNSASENKDSSRTAAPAGPLSGADSALSNKSVLQPQGNLNSQALQNAVESMRRFNERHNSSSAEHTATSNAATGAENDAAASIRDTAFRSVQEGMKKYESINAGKIDQRQDLDSLSRAVQRFEQFSNHDVNARPAVSPLQSPASTAPAQTPAPTPSPVTAQPPVPESSQAPGQISAPAQPLTSAQTSKPAPVPASSQASAHALAPASAQSLTHEPHQSKVTPSTVIYGQTSAGPQNNAPAQSQPSPKSVISGELSQGNTALQAGEPEAGPAAASATSSARERPATIIYGQHKADSQSSSPSQDQPSNSCVISGKHLLSSTAPQNAAPAHVQPATIIYGQNVPDNQSMSAQSDPTTASHDQPKYEYSIAPESGLSASCEDRSSPSQDSGDSADPEYALSKVPQSSLSNMTSDDFKLVYVQPGDDLQSLMSLSDSDTLVVPADMSQALTIFGQTRDAFKKAFVPYKKYIDLCEDEYLGRRNHNAPVMDRKLFPAEELFLGEPFVTFHSHVFTVIEFLQVLASQNPEDPVSRKNDDIYGRVQAVRLRRQLLRRIIFNNPVINLVSASGDKTTDQQWDTWRRLFNSYNKVNPNDDDVIDERILDNLKSRFTQFEKFKKAVNALKGNTSYAPADEHKWYSRFIFAYGINTVYSTVDLQEKTETAGSENSRGRKSKNASASITTRQSSGKTISGFGDVIFAMLQRASEQRKTMLSENKSDTGRTLFDIFFNDYHPFDEYAASINASETDSSSSSRDESIFLRCVQKCASENVKNAVIASQALACARDEGYTGEDCQCSPAAYFPYEENDLFKNLIDDIDSLVSAGLGRQALFLAAGELFTLYLIVFMLEQQKKIISCSVAYKHQSQASQSAKSSRPGKKTETDINMIICLVEKDISVLYERSKDRFKSNSELLEKSTRDYISQRFSRALDLTAPFLRKDCPLKDDEQQLLEHMLESVFSINRNFDDEEYSSLISAVCDSFGKDSKMQEKAVRALYKKVENKDNRIHEQMCRSIGLCSGQRSHFYTMSPSLLKTLTITVLGQRDFMKLSDFLAILKSRWHIVIGPDEAGKYINGKNKASNIGHDQFSYNLEIFKTHLLNMNMLIKLSDYCDYIKKPW